MAISAGDYTVGVAGDYADWQAAFDDIAGALTGDLSLYQISDISMTAKALLGALSLGAFNLKLGVATPNLGDPTVGPIATWTSESPFFGTCFEVPATVSTSGGVIELDGLHVVGAGTWITNVVLSYAGILHVIHDVLFDHAATAGPAQIFQPANNMASVEMWNVKAWSAAGNGVCAMIPGAGYDGTIAMENVVVYNEANTAKCFNFANIASATGRYVRNCVGIKAAGGAVAFDWGAIDRDHCASSDASADGTGSIDDIVPADEFLSLSGASPDFLRVDLTGQIWNAGAAPGIARNVRGCRLNLRPTGDGSVSMGSDQADIPFPASGMMPHFIPGL